MEPEFFLKKILRNSLSYCKDSYFNSVRAQLCFSCVWQCYSMLKKTKDWELYWVNGVLEQPRYFLHPYILSSVEGEICLITSSRYSGKAQSLSYQSLQNLLYVQVKSWSFPLSLLYIWQLCKFFAYAAWTSFGSRAGVEYGTTKEHFKIEKPVNF